MIRRSHWFTGDVPVETGAKDTHFLISIAPFIPASHGDVKLAEKIGELDPFVYATEHGEDVLLENVQWVIDSHEAEEAEKKKLG